jgi:leader peptidase (prepilin peptidase) / N-methyltransferase
MEMYGYIYAFVLGTMIGSFLNVVLYRFHTGRSINGRSHCMSCGETLSWYELFPIVSYLALRARCRHCSSYIPLRYLTVELLSGFTFAMLFSVFGFDLPLLFFYGVLFSFLMLILVYDIRHTIIPDEFTLAIVGCALVKVIGLPLLMEGGIDVHALIVSLMSGAGAAFFFYALWYMSKGRWLGLGDAKLAFPLGMIAGFPAALSMVVLAFWIGALISLILLGLKRVFEAGTTRLRFPLPRLTIHSEVPFAPFLILGFLLAHLFHADIFLITAYLLPLT